MLPQTSQPASLFHRRPATQEHLPSLGRAIEATLSTLDTRSLKRSGRASHLSSSAGGAATTRQQRALLSLSGRIRANQTLKGSLNSSDRRNALRLGRFADDYVLAGVRPGNWVVVSTQSNDLDTFLQVVDGRTGRVLWENDDVVPGNQRSRIGFVVKPGVNYRLRVTSYEADQKGDYTLTTRTLLTALPNDYSPDFGFGLLDAGAAVARATGQTNLDEVEDFGGALWNLDLVRAPEAWAKGYTGKDIVVAVLDTGLDITHPELAPNLWTNPGEIPDNNVDDDRNGLVDDLHGWNFLQGNRDISDGDGHGTHVAGTIAAASNNAGIVGVAPDAKIMPLKVLSEISTTSGRFDANVAQAIRYAANQGAKVINMSIGDFVNSMPETRLALRQARRAGVVAVMAAGNSKQDGMVRPLLPAFYAAQGLGIAAGAIDRAQILADFSNPAGNRPMPFFSAPGVGVRSTVPNNQFAVYDGTSMASPHIAGVVALMRGANPTLTPAQIEQILMETARFDQVVVV